MVGPPAARPSGPSVPPGVSDAGWRRPILFARSTIELPYPSGLVEAALLREPATWLPAVIEEGGAAVQGLLAGISAAAERYRFPLRGEITVHAPLRLRSLFMLPLSCRSYSPKALFPVADADLEVAPLDGARAELAWQVRLELRPDAAPCRDQGTRALVLRAADAYAQAVVVRAAHAASVRLKRSAG